VVHVAECGGHARHQGHAQIRCGVGVADRHDAPPVGLVVDAQQVEPAGLVAVLGGLQPVQQRRQPPGRTGGDAAILDQVAQRHLVGGVAFTGRQAVERADPIGVRGQVERALVVGELVPPVAQRARCGVGGGNVAFGHSHHVQRRTRVAAGVTPLPGAHPARRLRLEPGQDAGDVTVELARVVDDRPDLLGVGAGIGDQLLIPLVTGRILALRHVTRGSLDRAPLIDAQAVTGHRSEHPLQLLLRLDKLGARIAQHRRDVADLAGRQLELVVEPVERAKRDLGAVAGPAAVAKRPGQIADHPVLEGRHLRRHPQPFVCGGGQACGLAVAQLKEGHHGSCALRNRAELEASLRR
jgi:hypothetical protein